ncbi:hypothetical protein [Streptomyces sp. 7N604]|uniref:hypothetical protein n=1 Tax=Streptomyces sp. 7N604 TaxID=3457415 RepID=UPI003FD49D04
MRLHRAAGVALAAGAFVSMAAPVATAAPLSDDPGGSSRARLIAHPDSVRPGGTVSLTLFCPRDAERAEGSSRAGTVRFDHSGHSVFHGTLRVHRDTAPGTYTVRATCIGGRGGDGRDDGREEGRENGRDDMREDGRENGRDDMREDGRENGRDDMREDGRENGRENGRDDWSGGNSNSGGNWNGGGDWGGRTDDGRSGDIRADAGHSDRVTATTTIRVTRRPVGGTRGGEGGSQGLGATQLAAGGALAAAAVGAGFIVMRRRANGGRA